MDTQRAGAMTKHSPQWYRIHIDTAGHIEDRSAWGGGYGWTASKVPRPCYTSDLRWSAVVDIKGDLYLSQEVLGRLTDMTMRTGPGIRVGRRKLWKYTVELHRDIVRYASSEPRNSREREVSKRNLSLARRLAGLASIDEEVSDG